MHLIWFVVVWTQWSCPGGILKNVWPEPLKPLICKAETRRYITSSRDHAEREVRRRGPTSSMGECYNLKCVDVPLKWEMIVHIGEKK